METRSMKKKKDEGRSHEVNALVMCVKEIERLGELNKKLYAENKRLKSLLHNSTSMKEN